MIPGPEADRVLLAHMGECIERIREYTAGDRSHFEASRLVQDAVIRNLQTLTESSQRLSDDVKATEPQVPWRELSGFRNVIVHGYLGIDLAAVWLVVDQDLPPLAAALARMVARTHLPRGLRHGPWRIRTALSVIPGLRNAWGRALGLPDGPTVGLSSFASP